jgi:polar amino acid transport system substrate-binding protein
VIPVHQTLPPPAEDWERIKAAGTLVVGVAADYAPFEFYNSNFALDGFDIALMRALGEQMGVTVEFNDFAFNGLLDALRLGQVDVAISALSVTPDRQALVDFTNLYYTGDDAALGRTVFTGTIRSATDLAGLKVGVQSGTTYQTWVQQNAVDQGVIPQENLLAYDDVAVLLRNLRNGTVDVALLGALPAQQMDRRYTDLRIVGEKFNRQHFAIAARQGSSLVEPLNAALLAVQLTGVYDDLVAQYLQVAPETVTPDADVAQVDNTPPLTPTLPITTTPAAEPCINGMAYVADLNLDDRNMTAPPVMLLGQDFSKGWRVQNSGTCTWTAEYQLIYVNGNRGARWISPSICVRPKLMAPFRASGNCATTPVSSLAKSYG